MNIIATTELWCEPNANAERQGGYDPLRTKAQYSLTPDCCPCDHCPNRRQCRDEAMACQVYEEWLNPWNAKARVRKLNPSRIPSRGVFNRAK